MNESCAPLSSLRTISQAQPPRRCRKAYMGHMMCPGLRHMSTVHHKRGPTQSDTSSSPQSKCPTHHFPYQRFSPDAVVDDPEHLHHSIRRRRRRGGGAVGGPPAGPSRPAEGGARPGAAGRAAGGAVVARPPAPPGRHAAPLRGLASPRRLPRRAIPARIQLQPRPARPDHPPRPWRARA